MPELFATPVAECRWAKVLGEAEPNKFEPTKNPTWSIELKLDPTNSEHAAWMQVAEDHFATFHGDNVRKSANWLSLGSDKEDRSKMVAKFKLPCFTRKDQTKSPGPTVMDSAKKPWPHTQLIGNGSKVRIGYTVYAWSGPSGAGITLQPTHVQVIELVPYQSNPTPEGDPFEVEQVGYKLPEPAVVVTENEACPF